MNGHRTKTLRKAFRDLIITSKAKPQKGAWRRFKRGYLENLINYRGVRQNPAKTHQIKVLAMIKPRFNANSMVGVSLTNLRRWITKSTQRVVSIQELTHD